VAWSDYPFVALKRLTKVVGNVVMVLIVLTEINPGFSFKRFLTRTTFILIPSSILLIKYYSELGRYYDRWEGRAFFSGVSTDKNMLGAICMLSGLALLTRIIDVLRADAHQGRRLLALGTALAMSLWLLVMSHSATSLGCFVVAGSLIIFLGFFKRPQPWTVHLIAGSLALVGALSYTFPAVWAFLVEAAGRDPTLTGRTELWDDLLRLDTHPWLGAGFESFFLGERLEILWDKYWWHPNESHNGYLETYLTLGRIGLGLLALLTITGYRNAMNVYRSDPGSGALRLALLVITPIYNMTEAAFKVMNPIWILFLLAVTALPNLQRLEQTHKEPSPAPPNGGPLALFTFRPRTAPMFDVARTGGARPRMF
jgi:O-antigen ligase